MNDKERLSEQVRIVVFCPPSFKDEVFSVLQKQGAASLSWVEGTTTYTPVGEAKPTTGNVGVVSQEQEGKVSAFVDNRVLSNVRNEVSSKHPYESFAFEVYPVGQTSKPTFESSVKLRLKTADPERAMKVLSDMGAGVIGPYKDCFFWYEDGGEYRIETICERRLVDVQAVKSGFLSRGDFDVRVEELFEDPAAFGRGAN